MCRTMAAYPAQLSRWINKRSVRWLDGEPPAASTSRLQLTSLLLTSIVFAGAKLETLHMTICKKFFKIKLPPYNKWTSISDIFSIWVKWNLTSFPLMTFLPSKKFEISENLRVPDLGYMVDVTSDSNQTSIIFREFAKTSLHENRNYFLANLL